MRGQPDARARGAWIFGVLPFVGLAILGRFLDGYALSVLTLVFLFAFYGQAWNLILGFAGQLSLGHALFAGLGGYATLTVILRYGLSPWLGLFAGIALAAAAGAIIGWLGFRFALRGVHFALLTIAFAEFTRVVFSNWDLVGSTAGLFLPTLPPDNNPLLSLRGGTGFFYGATLLLAAGGSAFTAWLRRARLGYVWRAMRDEEAAARALGVRVFRHKVAATAISAGMTGLGGAISALMAGSLFPDTAFGLGLSIEIIVGPIIGGLGTAFGPLVGAAFTVMLAEGTGHLGQALGVFGLNTLAYGLALILTIGLLPEGLWPAAVAWWQRRQTPRATPAVERA